MPTFGCFLSAEENGPRVLVEQAQMAERAGLEAVSISDHFHPWMDAQGESPFVWSVIGGIAASTSLTVTTAVTCPILRIHPAILAQATATSSQMLGGRFRFGVGTGERLNEHVLGQHWPPAEIRRDMLTEAIDLIRQLWAGDMVTHRGTYYTVENARIFTQPSGEVPVIVSAFGTDAAALAADIGDGLMTTTPDKETLRAYADGGGSGPTVATVKICWAPDEAEAKRTAHRLWASSGVPGQSSQELATPAHFEEAAELVTIDGLAEKIPCGPDPERHAEAIGAYVDAGFDEIHIGQIGDDHEGFFKFLADELLPRL